VKRRTLLTGATAFAVAPAVVRAQDAIKMRVSIEVAATHKRTDLIQQ